MAANWRRLLRDASLNRRLTVTVTVLFLLSAALLLSNGRLNDQYMQRQLIMAYRALTESRMEQADGLLADAQQAVVSATAKYDDMLLIAAPQYDNAMYLAQTRVKNELTRLFVLNGPMKGIFCYAKESDAFLDTYDDTTSSAEHAEDVAQIRAFLLEKGTTAGGWACVRAGERPLLLRALHIGDIYFGVWLDAQALLRSVAEGMPELVSDLYLTDGEGRMIASLGRTDVDMGRIGAEDVAAGVYRAAEDYLLVGRAAAKGSIGLISLISLKGVTLLSVPTATTTVSFVLCLCVLCVLLFVTLRSFTVTPLEQLLQRARQAGRGAPPPGLTRNEHALLTRFVEDMSGELEELKLQAYRDQLDKQKAELQFYQQQVQPHFFANCLNMIYNAAQIGDSAVAQRMAELLSRYYRYSLRDGSLFVALRLELEHVHDYVAIQQMRFRHVDYREDVAPALLGVDVLPMLVTTFVENAITHALDMEHPLEIRVEAEQTEDERIRVRVMDNGEGFPPEQLEALNRGEDLGTADGRHIGIENARRRLWLAYGERMAVCFRNRETGGAQVDIAFPVCKPAREEGGRNG